MSQEYRYRSPWSPKLEKVKIEKDQYANGRIVLQMYCWTQENGLRFWEPFMTISINLPEAECPEGEAYIKDYSENEGILEWLLKNKIVSPMTGFASSGFITATRHKVLI